MLMEWKDITEQLTEKQRYYSDGYLVVSETYDEVLEISLYRFTNKRYEIYFKFEDFYGLVCVSIDKINDVKDTMKKELEEEYKKNGKPSSKFINYFDNKFDVTIPLII